MQDRVLTPDDLADIAAIATNKAEETVTRLWSGQANVAMVTPGDLNYRGKGVYYSETRGWFSKGPGGSLLELPGPPQM